MLPAEMYSASTIEYIVHDLSIINRSCIGEINQLSKLKPPCHNLAKKNTTVPPCVVVGGTVRMK